MNLSHESIAFIDRSHFLASWLRHKALKFPNAVVLSAVRCRNTQMSVSANERKVWVWVPFLGNGPGKPNQRKSVRELFAGAFWNKSSI